MGRWPACGRPSRSAAVPPWRRRRHWVAAGPSGVWGTGTSDWHAPICNAQPRAQRRIRRGSDERLQESRNTFWDGQYLILSVTPWGTPTLTVADRTLCRLIFLSAPYSTTVPNQPVLERGQSGNTQRTSEDGNSKPNLYPAAHRKAWFTGPTVFTHMLPEKLSEKKVKDVVSHFWNNYWHIRDTMLIKNIDKSNLKLWKTWICPSVKRTKYFDKRPHWNIQK